MQSFVGRLDTSADVAEGSFRVKLYFTDDELEVATFDGDVWTWPMTTVQMTRIRADRFQLDLGNETLYFSPDDPLAFTIRFTEWTEPAKTAEPSASSKRGWLRRRIEDAAAGSAPVDEPTYTPEPAEPSSRAKTRFGRRSSHTHIWEKTVSAGVARRRCADCGHISIDLTGVTSAFDQPHGESVSVG